MTSIISYADKLKIGLEDSSKRQTPTIYKKTMNIHKQTRILNDKYIENIGEYLINFYIEKVLETVIKLNDDNISLLLFDNDDKLKYIDIVYYLWAEYKISNIFKKKAILYVFNNNYGVDKLFFFYISDIKMAFQMAYKGFENLSLYIDAKKDYDYFQKNLHIFDNKVFDIMFDERSEYYTVYEIPGEKYFPDGLKNIDFGYIFQFYNLSNPEHTGDILKHLPNSITHIKGLTNTYLTDNDKKLLRDNKFPNLEIIRTKFYIEYLAYYKIFYTKTEGIIE